MIAPRTSSDLALRVGRIDTGIVVALSGRCMRSDLEVVDIVVRDLIEGQGNPSVTLDIRGLRGPGADLGEMLVGLAYWACARGARFAVSNGRTLFPLLSAGDGGRLVGAPR